MKSWKALFFIMMAVAYTLAAAPSWLQAVNTAAAQAKATIIVKVGIVKVLRKGTKDEIDAQKGMLLYGGDLIKTSELSRAALVLNDGSITKLHEKTNLVLIDNQADQKVNRLKLLLGQLWASIKKQKHPLEIDTPSAVAAIKGTVLELKVNPDEKVQLTVWEGLVDFYNPQGKVEVGASYSSTVFKGQKPQKPRKINLGQQDQWWESVVEIPTEKELKLNIMDKNGREQQLNINYNKQ